MRSRGVEALVRRRSCEAVARSHRGSQGALHRARASLAECLLSETFMGRFRDEGLKREVFTRLVWWAGQDPPRALHKRLQPREATQRAGLAKAPAESLRCVVRCGPKDLDFLRRSYNRQLHSQIATSTEPGVSSKAVVPMRSSSCPAEGDSLRILFASPPRRGGRSR